MYYNAVDSRLLLSKADNNGLVDFVLIQTDRF